MVDFILLYNIRGEIKKVIREKITDEFREFTNACKDCLTNELAWEVYYFLEKGDIADKNKLILKIINFMEEKLDERQMEIPSSFLDFLGGELGNNIFKMINVQ